MFKDEAAKRRFSFFKFFFIGNERRTSINLDRQPGICVTKYINKEGRIQKNNYTNHLDPKSTTSIS